MKKRLSWGARHRQLIEVALDHVRREGADGLTLAKVAEEAGVTKPLAYDHFKTREGLLIELCLEFDEIQRTELKKLQDDPDADLRKLALSVSQSYMDCYAKSVGEWHAIYAVMRGSPELAKVQQDVVEKHVDMLVAMFGPKSELDPVQLRLTCMGLIGAAESISAALTQGETSIGTAVEALARMFLTSFGSHVARND